MIRESFGGYVSLCGGRDEVFGGRCVDWVGMGVTVVDSLDTLWMTGMEDLWKEGVEWVSRLSFQKRVGNVFEVTIRVLGGLLSAYALSGERILLTKAEEVGSLLLSDWEEGSFPSNVQGRRQSRFSLAEVGSLQLEFRYLWHATNRSDLRSKIMSRACLPFSSLTRRVTREGLLTPEVGKSGESLGWEYHIGGGADSFYEYMLKTHLQDGGSYPCAYERYKVARDAIRTHLLLEWGEGISYLARVRRVSRGRNTVGRVTSRTMGHLDCFAPGMLALDFIVGGDESVFFDAKKLMRGCWQLYNLTSTVGAESAHFGRKNVVLRDRQNLLRPEVAESLYYLWKASGDSTYRRWGEEMLNGFRSHSRFLFSGSVTYCSMRDVMRPSCDGKMESFWIAETLKYLYLLQTDSLDLKKWVLNTEAHPFPIIPSLPPCSCKMI